jgi:hypothetical protein
MGKTGSLTDPTAVRWALWLVAGIVAGLALGFTVGLTKPRQRVV